MQPKAYVFYATYGHWTQCLLNAGYNVIGHYQPNINTNSEVMVEDRLAHRVLDLNFSISHLRPGYVLSNSNDIDIIVGSPPCIGLSRGSPISRLDHPANKHTLNFAKEVIEFQPRLFLMEMVPELLTKGAELFTEYMTILKEYYHCQYAVLEACNYGAAQRRPRLFTFGQRMGKQSAIRLAELPLRPYKTIGQVIPEEVLMYWDNYTPDNRMLMSMYKKNGELQRGPYSILVKNRERRTIALNSVSFTLNKFSVYNMLFQRDRFVRNFSIPELQLIMGFPLEYRFPSKNIQEVSRMIASGVDLRIGTYLLEYIREKSI